MRRSHSRGVGVGGGNHGVMEGWTNGVLGLSLSLLSAQIYPTLQHFSGIFAEGHIRHRT